MYQQEMKEHIPKEILLCKAVAREISFTSTEQLDKFRIEQRIYFHGKCIEVPSVFSLIQQPLTAVTLVGMVLRLRICDSRINEHVAANYSRGTSR